MIEKLKCLSCGEEGTQDDLYKTRKVEEKVDGHCRVGDIISYNHMKDLRLTELRALQDLIYGDCLRDDRSIEDVEWCADKMRKAFKIGEVK